jgi:putative cardiolipin synthase
MRRALCVLALLLGGCAALPSLENRTASSAFTDTADTRLGRALAPRVAANPGMSGVFPLLDGHDAFAARVLLARTAERSLDIQYYIWNADLSGTLLFRALLDAAARGVRVRVLLDDNNTTGLDPMLAALDAHPNVEVRLFNPFASRASRWLGYLTDFSRLNRRMHNKSFTADNQATIVGGRNVGDEYFGAGEGQLFVDLDVIAVGPVVPDVSRDFDRYWESGSSYPADRLLAPATFPLPDVAASAASYLEAVRRSPFVGELLEGRLPLEWVPVRLISDDPAKGLGRAAPGSLLPDKLKDVLGEPRSDMDLVSAYFVPAEAGTAMFVDLARRGVKLRILTNSLEATDVAVVHSGYAKRREVLLEAGAALYELRRLSPERAARDARLVSRSGSSASSLHAKIFAVDRTRVFIGSFNFDPRSARLNTEMGFVIDSPALAQKMAEAFERRIPADSYEVRLSDEDRLYWIERRRQGEVRHDVEPGTTFWKRSAVWLLSLLPLDWLL